MRLSETVYLIGSGGLGCGLSHPDDCNVYAVDCGGPVLVVDTGVGKETHRLLETLAGDGIDPARVVSVLLTHAHLDHSGGAAWLARRCESHVVASVDTADIVEAGDEERSSLRLAKNFGLYPPDATLLRCPVASRVRGGDVWAVGDATVRAVRTPGHSMDSLSFLVSQPAGVSAFTGDALFHGGKILVSITADCSPADYALGLRALAAEEFDGLYPGHGLWSTRDGHGHARACLPFLDRLLLPPNFM